MYNIKIRSNQIIKNKIKKQTLKQIFANEESLTETNNIQLIDYLKKYNKKNGYIFKGVIMKDEIRKQPKQDKTFYIINYDNSNQDGSHWVAVVKNNDKIYYYDSYGLPPLKQIKNYYTTDTIYYSDRPVQLQTSSICGHLCIAFIEHMLSNGDYYEFISKCIKYSNRYNDDVNSK